MRVSVVWFRNDLRLHDNLTLLQAVKESDIIIPVYIFDDRHFRISSSGFHKTGPFRTRFLLECVADLRSNLRSCGSELVVRKGDTATILKELCFLHGVSALYYSSEVAPYERSEELKVQEAMQSVGVETYSYANSMLLCRDTLPFNVQAMPDMFTAFRWQVEKLDMCVMPLPSPGTIKTPAGLDAGCLPDASELCPTEIFNDARAVMHFRGGESEGLARLKKYVWEANGPATYFETRNGLIGEAYSTKLSPWLAAGAVSARQIYKEIKLYELKRVANKSTYWIVFELLWRDFFRLNMEKYNSELFFLRGPKRKAVTTTNNFELFLKWANGQTDDDFVNANMNELNRTGFMSNRGRQNVASYLVHDMNVDWLLGAAYFESMLIDYDVCSNYGNWAYIAGVGNDPRDNRHFNTAKQAATYDSDGAYRKLWKGGTGQ